MAKRKDIEDKSAAPSGDALTPSAIETKAIEPASEAPKLETPKVEAAPIALAKDELPAIEAPKLAAEAPKLTTEAPTVVREAPKVAEIKIAAEDKAAPTPLAAEASAPAVPVASARINRFALLAASVAIAAAIGAMSGALGASGLLWSAGPTQVAEAASTPTIVDETRALHGTLAQLRTDLRDLVGDGPCQVVFPEAEAVAADAQFGGGAQQLLRVRLRDTRDGCRQNRQFLAPLFQGFDEPGQFVRRTLRLDLALRSHRTFDAVPANLRHGVGGLLEVQILKRFGEADDPETLFPSALGEKARRNGSRRNGSRCCCGGKFPAGQEVG